MTTLQHRIWLRGPWHYEWLDDPVDQEASAARGSRTGKVKLPLEWASLFSEAEGLIRFRRRFHRPTNLDADERVQVCFEGLGCRAVVSVNGIELKATDANAKDSHAMDVNATGQTDSVIRFDLTESLEFHNELTVDLELPPRSEVSETAGLWAPVALEIRRGSAS